MELVTEMELQYLKTIKCAMLQVKTITYLLFYLVLNYSFRPKNPGSTKRPNTPSYFFMQQKP